MTGCTIALWMASQQLETLTRDVGHRFGNLDLVLDDAGH
jgi:hypothetical protein